MATIGIRIRQIPVCRDTSWQRISEDLLLKVKYLRGGNRRKFRNSPPLLTNSIQVLELVERGRWRVQQTKLQPPSQKGSVALECFGLSKVRFAGCLSVSEQGAQALKGTASGCWRIYLARFD